MGIGRDTAPPVIGRGPRAGARSGRRVVSGAAAAGLLLAAGLVRPALGGERVPVVFVPGFLGSKLADDQGELWGSLTGVINRAADLAYGSGKSHSPIRVTGLVSRIRLFGPLETAGYRPIISLFEKLGFAKNRDLFLFPYDWRKSNFESARALAAFIDRVPALRKGPFNLVAHSMGGVVSSIYLQRHGGASRVKYFVTLGTPHLGSMRLLGNMFGDFGGKASWLRLLIGNDTFLRVLLSFPSVYEQLPGYDRSCLVVGDGEADPRTCDLLDGAFWAKLAPADMEPPVLPRRLDAYLAGARRLRTLACAKLPPNVRTFRFAGSRVQTLGRIVVSPRSGLALDWDYVPGDGAVPEFSASCGDLAGTEIVFADHLGMLTNEIVRYRLTNILLDGVIDGPFAERPTYRALPPAAPRSEEERAPTAWPVVSFELASHYFRRGEKLAAVVTLRSPGGDAVGGATVAAGVLSADARRSLRRVAAVEREPGRFELAFPVELEPGIYRLRAGISKAGHVERYFAVLEENDDSAPAKFTVSSAKGPDPVFRVGETLDLSVTTSRDAWVYCFYRQADGRLIKIFPNRRRPRAFVAGGRTYSISDDIPYDITFVEPPGVDLVTCFATGRDVSAELPSGLRGLDFTPLPRGTEARLPGLFRRLGRSAVAEARLKITVTR